MAEKKINMVENINEAFSAAARAKKAPWAWLAALAVPLAYLALYTPLGMDTTDFGYFYGYAWRILEGQIPYRDFYYIKPALPLYWHAFWLWLTPGQWEILAGKAGFLFTLLIASWLSALCLQKLFDLEKLGLPLPLLASAGFVFSIHSFPHMPWHTADGALFCAAALYFGACGRSIASGCAAACAMLCKQSFLLVPAGLLIFLILRFRSPRKCAIFAAAWLASLSLFFAWIWANGAWAAFRAMTTGQLDIREALDAGIWIYLRQNWILPCLAILPWLACRASRKKTPDFLLPAYVYLALLMLWQIYIIRASKVWVGYGASWPTLFMLLGGLCVLFPRSFLLPAASPALAGRALACSAGLGAMLVASWSTAISGGYKIPAMMATPLLFSFFMAHRRLGGSVRRLAWASLFCGLILFGAAYQYPYIFPVRPLERADLVYDAGEVYPMARGVKVDRVMLEKLRELKELRAKYGPNYKTLPGFSFAYYLNRDYPVYSSDWLINWEINGDVDRLVKELEDKDLFVFMEWDQMDAEKADNYERAAYGVPQAVRKTWKIIDETPHFVVFRRPDPN